MVDFHIIGDVHGSGEKLEGLLRTLGYAIENGVYRHRDRQAIFVGDLVDRGPDQLRVLQIVKAMVDAGSAQIVMGNHEFNALAYATFDERRQDYCRKHTKTNQHTHGAFLDQLEQKEREFYLAWFQTMPLWLDMGEVRVVHACWHQQSIKVAEEELGGNRFTSTEQIIQASLKGTALFKAVEVLRKGPELSLKKYDLPPFKDKDDRERDMARLRWWVRDSELLRDLAEIPSSHYPMIPEDLRIKEEDLLTVSDSTPVIYGHYWRKWGRKGQAALDWKPLEGLDWTPTTACVDFSAVRRGPLVAYEWNRGDTEIAPTQFIGYR